MSRKVLIPILIVVVAAAATIGVLAARAQGSTTLPEITPSQLLADVATKSHDTKSLSGDVSWSNGLLGDTSALNLGGATTPTGIASLLQGGKGRVWLQDGKVRLESQGQGGDLVVTAADGSVWTYSSATNTATQYSAPAGTGGTESATPTPSASAFDPTAQIDQALQKLAPTAKLAVTGQESVAGQQSYILELTPTASSTTFGSLRVAIDGTTFVPLRIEVFAKGASTPDALGRLHQRLVREHRRRAVPLHAPVGRQGRAQDAHAPLRARGGDRCAGAVGAGEQVGGRGEASHPRAGEGTGWV